jgi:hypothetical protein
MKTKFLVAAALAGPLLATCLVSGPAQATPLPILKSDPSLDIVTLVGKRGGGGAMRGGGGGGRSAMRGGGGGGYKGAYRGGGGYKGGYRGGGGRYAYKGGGYKGGYRGGGGRYAYKGGGYKGGYRGGGGRYAYKGRDHGYYNRYRHYGYGRYRRYGYGLPYISYGYGGGCNWLYRNAIATGSSYWWNRYYQCVGYY